MGHDVLLPQGGQSQAALYNPAGDVFHMWCGGYIVTDGRSQFRAMEIFLTGLGVEHSISSDYNPHSNLRAGTTKMALDDNKYTLSLSGSR